MYIMKKLNTNGHAHLLLAAAVIVVGIAAFGTYRLVTSNADSFSKNGVKVATTKTPAIPIKTTPAPAAAATPTELNASNQKVAAPNREKCAQLHRVWSQNICAWSSVSHDAPNNYCDAKNRAYAKGSPYDGCLLPGPTH